MRSAPALICLVLLCVKFNLQQRKVNLREKNYNHTITVKTKNEVHWINNFPSGTWNVLTSVIRQDSRNFFFKTRPEPNRVGETCQHFVSSLVPTIKLNLLLAWLCKTEHVLANSLTTSALSADKLVMLTLLDCPLPGCKADICFHKALIASVCNICIFLSLSKAAFVVSISVVNCLQNYDVKHSRTPTSNLLYILTSPLRLQGPKNFLHFFVSVSREIASPDLLDAHSRLFHLVLSAAIANNFRIFLMQAFLFGSHLYHLQLWDANFGLVVAT